ncbi:hypothetical protein HDE80_003416 [Rhodanobacter sp. A1T4]|nr:hypothetical protein [Rhodanobacter sp. A1T4]
MRNDLNDAAQQNVARVGVRPPAARREVERLARDARHELVERGRIAGNLLDIGTIEILWQTAGMREHLPERDFIGMRRVRQVGRQFVVDVQFAGLLQLQDSCSSELLGNRTDFKIGVYLYRQALFAIAQTIGFAVDDATVLSNGYRGAWCAGALKYGFDIGIDPLCLLRPHRIGSGDSHGGGKKGNSESDTYHLTVPVGNGMTRGRNAFGLWSKMRTSKDPWVIPFTAAIYLQGFVYERLSADIGRGRSDNSLASSLECPKVFAC